MVRGINTAAAGLLADERMQQVIANNLANAQTPGFKESIGELMAYPQQQIQLSGYNSNTGGKPIGQMGLGVLFQESVPVFSQGQLTPTGGALDIGIQDNTPSGLYAVVQTGAIPAKATGGAPSGIASANGPIAVGQAGRLSIGGQPLAVVDANGAPIPGMYAIKNPAYSGSQLTTTDGKPAHDAKGNPSYVFANAAGKILGTPGDAALNNAAIRVGNSNDMGMHSFLPVSFTAYDGTSGIALTRDGHLSVNSQQWLTDANGSPILPVGANGQPIQNGRIVMNTAYHGTAIFNNNGTPVVDSQGNPSYFVETTNGQRLQGGRLGTVNADVTTLKPLGQGEFMVGQTLQPTAVLTYLKPGTGSLKPGELEQSNVNTTATMTQMMAVMANYQANQLAMQAEDTELQKAVQDVGHVNL
ncbi:flagellar basal body rod protein [Alicyclobacillus curvatus]|nr:flagellar basal body rod protein [Alicyclobacillus curvatus]